MKREHFKRLLSGLLALIMIVGLIPATPVSAAGEKEYYDVYVSTYAQLRAGLEHKDNQKVILTSNIVMEDPILDQDEMGALSFYDPSVDDNRSIVINGNKILELNGWSILYKDSTNARIYDDTAPDEYRSDIFNRWFTTMIHVPDHAELIVNDAGNGTGGIAYYGYMIGCDPNDYYHIYTHRDIFKVDGTLIINNGQFQAGEIKHQGGVEYEEDIETGEIMPSLLGTKLWTCTWGTVVNARSGAKVVINGGTLTGHGSSNESRDAVIEAGDNADILINNGKFVARGGANVFSVTDLTHLQVRKAKFDTHACPFDEDAKEEDIIPGGKDYNREWKVRCLDHPESGNERFYRTRGGKLRVNDSILFNEYTGEWLTDYVLVSIDRVAYEGDEIPSSFGMGDYREITIAPNHRTDAGMIYVTQRSDRETYIHNKDQMAGIAWSTQDYELKLSFNTTSYYNETDLIDRYVKTFTWKVWNLSKDPDVSFRAPDYSYWGYYSTMDMEALADAAGFDWDESDSWQVRCDVDEGAPSIGYFTVQSNPIDIAIVEENPYRVQYTANGGSYTNDHGVNVVNFEETGRVDASLTEIKVKLSDKVPVREGYKFEGYAVQHYGKGQLPGTYQPGDYVTITSGYPTYENRIVVIANWSRVPLRECVKVTVEYPTYFEVGEEITITAIPTPAEPTDGQYHYTWEVWYPDTDETEVVQGTTSPELKYTFEDARPRVFYVYVNNYTDGNLSEGSAYGNTPQLYPCAELYADLYVNGQLITGDDTTVHVKMDKESIVEVQTIGGRKPYQYYAMARYGAAPEFATLAREVNTDSSSHSFRFDPFTFTTASFRYVVKDDVSTVSTYTVNIESHAPISFHSCREAETVINKPTEVNLWLQVNGYDISGKCYELIDGSWVELEGVTVENASCPVYVRTPGVHQYKVVLTDYFGESISREFTIIYDDSVPQEVAADGSGTLAFRDCDNASGEFGTVFADGTDVVADVLEEFDYDPASSLYTDVRTSVKQNTGLEIQPVADWVTVDLRLYCYDSYEAYVSDGNDYVDVYAEAGKDVDDMTFQTDDGIPDVVDLLTDLEPGYYVMEIDVLNRSNDPYWQKGGLGPTNSFTVTGSFEILETGAEHIHNYEYNVEAISVSEHEETCYCGETRQVAHAFDHSAFDQRWNELAYPISEDFTLYSGVEYRQCSCEYAEYRWAYVDTFMLDQEEIALKPNAQSALIPTITFQGTDPEWESMLGGFTEEEIAQFTTPNTAIIWTSSNEEVVTVDESGMITAVGQGTAVITATTVQRAGKEQASAVAACTVTVGCPHENVFGMTGQDATCMAAGWKTHYYCEDCNAVSLDGTFEDTVTYEADIQIKKLPHMLSSAWSFDEENHFHACTYGCGTVSGVQAHTPNVEAASCEQNQFCTVCSVELAPRTGHAHASYGQNETEHWSICACGEILADSNAFHIYGGDDVCDSCGYTRPALGYVPVETANVTIEVPVHGGNPSYTVTCDGEGYTASVIGWIHADQIGGSAAVDATHSVLCGTYILQLRFTPKTGYGFNEDTVFTVNGQSTSILDGDYGRQIAFELPHVSAVSYEEQLPTCTAGGHNAYSYCPDCDTYTLDGSYNDNVDYEQDILLEQAEHNFEGGKCTNCGEKEPGGVEVVATGYTGNNKWTLTSDGLLYIYGNGNMKYYGWVGNAQWLPYADLITEVVIEEGVTSVGTGAFMNLTSLERVSLPETSLKTLGQASFYGCSSLKEIYIPDGIYTIWEYTFKGCTSLESIRFPKTLIKIAMGAFENCTALTDLTLPGNLNILGNYSFNRCSGLVRVDMQWTDATEIRAGAFKRCTSLTEILLPANIEVLGDSCFHSTGFTSFTVPATVKKIEGWCFSSAQLQEITFEGDAPVFGITPFNHIPVLTAKYPADNDTWTDDVRQDYGCGDITWIAE